MRKIYIQPKTHFVSSHLLETDFLISFNLHIDVVVFFSNSNNVVEACVASFMHGNAILSLHRISPLSGSIIWCVCVSVQSLWVRQPIPSELFGRQWPKCNTNYMRYLDADSQMGRKGSAKKRKETKKMVDMTIEQEWVSKSVSSWTFFDRIVVSSLSLLSAVVSLFTRDSLHSAYVCRRISVTLFEAMRIRFVDGVSVVRYWSSLFGQCISDYKMGIDMYQLSSKSDLILWPKSYAMAIDCTCFVSVCYSAEYNSIRRIVREREQR